MTKEDIESIETELFKFGVDVKPFGWARRMRAVSKMAVPTGGNVTPVAGAATAGQGELLRGIFGNRVSLLQVTPYNE